MDAENKKPASRINAATGEITLNLLTMTPDQLGETLRAHVYGVGNGYRDMHIDDASVYTPVTNPLPDAIVDEMLGDSECRDDWMKVHAWTDGNLMIAYACDGDTSLLFQLNLPNGTRTIVNHDAKCDYGWNEVA